MTIKKLQRLHLKQLKEKEEQRIKDDLKIVSDVCHRALKEPQEIAFATAFGVSVFLEMQDIPCKIRKVAYVSKGILSTGIVLNVHGLDIDFMRGHILGKKHPRARKWRIETLYPRELILEVTKDSTFMNDKYYRDEPFDKSDLQDCKNFLIKMVSGVNPSAHAVNRYIARINPLLSFEEAELKLKGFNLVGGVILGRDREGYQIVKEGVVYCYTQDMKTLTTVFKEVA